MSGPGRLAIACALALFACGGGGGDDTGPDATPCSVDPAGECAGDTLQRCDADGLVTENCAAALASCVEDGAGASCVDACEEAGVTAQGSCTEDGAERCVIISGKHEVDVEVCGLGTSCVQPTGGTAACVSDPCDLVGPQGRCVGEVLTRCDTGEPVETDCAETNDLCTYTGDSTGYGCVAPAGAGAWRVHGVIQYEDRPPLTSGALGQIRSLPVRGAQVVVILDQGSAELASAVVSDDGSYALHYDAADGAQVHISVAARSPLSLRPVSVRRNSSQVHAFGGPTFTAAAEVAQDLLVTSASATAEAFNILDQLIAVMDLIREVFGNPSPSPLIARWSQGSSNGTYYSSGSIYLLGASDDDDGYDDTVILHECGHFVEDTEGRTDSPGGSHDGSPTDPRLAWSEGFSTYLALAVRGESVYMDSNSWGGWGWDAESSVTTASASGSISQNVSEDMVAEDLWDLGDGGTDDDPMVSAGHAAVLRVQSDYLATTSLRPVGVSGVDLVDFLDGWFLIEGLDACSSTRAIATDVRAFPYDYAGPAGACP